MTAINGDMAPMEEDDAGTDLRSTCMKNEEFAVLDILSLVDSRGDSFGELDAIGCQKLRTGLQAEGADAKGWSMLIFWLLQQAAAKQSLDFRLRAGEETYRP